MRNLKEIMVMEKNMEKEVNETIDKNLEIYSKLKEIIKTAKRTELYTYPYKNQNIDEKEYTIWGVIYISQNHKWNSQYFSDWLLRLENLITLLSPKFYSKEQIKNGLLNNPFNFLSELIFADFCLTNNIKIIKTEPELVSGNKLDFLIEKENLKILVEVIHPLPKLKWSEIKCGGFAMSLELENNIYNEFKEHKIIENKIEQPFIIVMDSYRWNMDTMNVNSAIKKFNEKYLNLSYYLSGIFLMNGQRYNFNIGIQIGNHTFLENDNTKYKISLT